MTLEGFFKPTIIFFGLTNLLATFWIMMNKILWNLINTREVASSINDVIVGIQREDKYDEVVKRVVKRLVENDLYIKLEKCK